MSGPITRLGVPIIALPPLSPPVAARMPPVMPVPPETYRTAPARQQEQSASPEAVRSLEHALLNPLSLMERRGQWIESLTSTRPCGDLTDSLRIAALLDRQEDETARRLCRRIVQQYIRIQVVPFAEMDAAGEATYTMPQNAGEVPVIRLLNLFEVYPSENPIDLALTLVANTLHEFVHIELEQGGTAWDPLTVVPIEMTAYTMETSLRLANGDDTFYRRISELSPSGYFLGLRNFVEFARQRRLWPAR